MADRLTDVIDNIDAIARYIGTSTFEDYAADRLRKDATERCLERIIEAVVKIGNEQMSVVDPAFPVERARGLGNMLRHAYEEIDEGLIYNVVVDELPRLRAACAAALAS
ncbi:HepT-like ribonuclease domain-containing protein [Sphingomonas oligophenolica]|uniref:HepT-like ribonuclease domain-containing protein n=1 Tax=Sphingomonas oligophenolica TaxID=301154 RepID=UPI001F4FC81D|nr:DUF86 domain-containing protein [Sphingomonas oligophenolica]